LTNGELVSGNGIGFQMKCTIPETVDQLTRGAEVWIDEGRVGTTVESKSDGAAMLRVIHTRRKGGRVRPGKGLNFPQTDLQLSSLTPQDLETLDFVAHNADIIGYSFVRAAEDVTLLQQELEARIGSAWRRKPVIAKIETKRAVSNLPEIIVRGAGNQPFGVMIARGDLAVEIGFQRLAEIQEELLWVCEAAHVPVVWATEVLQRLVSTGTPSRAEFTDAAMAQRAECVMLNRGPFLSEAVTALSDVMARMTAHQQKKSSQLRALQSW
jgi:pyruvate kinase